MNPAMDDAEKRKSSLPTEDDFGLLPRGNSSSVDSTVNSDSDSLVDSVDDIILIKLDQREQQVAPGESVTFVLTLLNNGPKAASFRLRIEGWVRNSWVTLTPTHTWLSPGEGHRFELTISPPALPKHGAPVPELAAGERPFLITVLSPEYPQRQSQLRAKIDLLPVLRYALGTPRPKRLVSSWQNQSASTMVPVTNQGNVPAHIVLEGASKGQRRETACRFEFMTLGATGHSLGQSRITLNPGQTVQMHVRVTPVERVLFSLGSETLPFCVAAWPVEGGPSNALVDARGFADEEGTRLTEQGQNVREQLAYGQVKRVPLIGVGLAATVATTMLGAMVAAGLLGLTTLMAILPATRASQQQPQTIIMRAPEQPQLEIVVKVAEPVPSPRTLAAVESPERALLTVADAIVEQAINSQSGNDSSSDASAEDNALVVADGGDTSNSSPSASPKDEVLAAAAPREVPELQPVQYINGVPVVQAGMISSPEFTTGANEERIATNPTQNISPQGGATVRGAIVRADSVSAPVRNANSLPENSTLTYERMFKEVAQSFDLDWRILAAQAYVESGFDPLAVGTKGDMGLMQILPSTWAEWAGRTGATDPYNGYHNVSVSAVYSSSLRDIFAAQGYEDPRWRLVAYNWGPNRLRLFLNAGRTWDELPEGRKKYAQDILRIAASLPLE